MQCFSAVYLSYSRMLDSARLIVWVKEIIYAGLQQHIISVFSAIDPHFHLFVTQRLKATALFFDHNRTPITRGTTNGEPIIMIVVLSL